MGEWGFVEPKKSHTLYQSKQRLPCVACIGIKHMCEIIVKLTQITMILVPWLPWLNQGKTGNLFRTILITR